MSDTRDSAISPVVGAILMVAVTVVLSATVGMVVFQMQPSSPGDTQSGIKMQETDDGVTVTAVTASSEMLVEYNGVVVATLNQTGDEVVVPAAPGEQVTVLSKTNGKTTVVMSRTVSESPGLLAYYPLDGSGLDKSENQLNATPVRANVTTGLIKEGYYFNGTDELRLPRTVFPGNYQTVCFYAKPYLIKASSLDADGTTWDDHNIMHDNGRNDPDNEYGWHLYENDTVSVGYGGEGLETSVMTYSGIPEDRWTFFCHTVGENTMRLYVNGTVVNSTATHSGALNYVEEGRQPLFGRHKPGSASDSWTGLYGRLDEVRFYKKPLSPDQVGMLYNMTQNASG